jgi:PleD family two-component response regulator
VVEASFGLAVYEPGESADRLVARADQVLYDAKRRRRLHSVRA